MILFCQARASLIDKQYEADREKLHKIRLLLVRSLIFWKKKYLLILGDFIVEFILQNVYLHVKLC